MNKIFYFFIFFLINFTLGAQTANLKFEGQLPMTEIPNTQNHAIVPQWQGKRVFGNITFDNNFEGARLNGITQNNDSLFTAIITAENYPINPSPWYAFKVSSKTPQTIWVHLTYLNAKHRYFPKYSFDGKVWQTVDSADCRLEKDTTIKAKNFQDNALSESAFVRIRTDNRPIWIAAQEIMTSKMVAEWERKLTDKKFVSCKTIGKSTQDREMNCLRIGEDKTDSKIIVVIGRLHPPEVTGQIAEQAFVESLCDDSELAQRFRKIYTVFVIPMVNPDGVDNGHWRHNAGGIDLNRDWFEFNQPETRIVRDFLRQKINGTPRKMYFGIDFHSTWDDIFYTNTTTKPTTASGLIQNWFAALESAIPNYKVNARASKITEGVISKAFFAREFNAESLTYEVGDNTSRDFTRLKSRIAAEKLMELLMLQLDKESKIKEK